MKLKAIALSLVVALLQPVVACAAATVVATRALPSRDVFSLLSRFIPIDAFMLWCSFRLRPAEHARNTRSAT